MDIFLFLFRDTLGGSLYIPYFILCIVGVFYVYGQIADRKRKMINDKLKEKKTYDIVSGREAAIAAMESKQILTTTDEHSDVSDIAAIAKPEEEKVPEVMVFDSSNSQNNSSDTNINTDNQEDSAPKVDGPIVIDSSSLEI